MRERVSWCTNTVSNHPTIDQEETEKLGNDFDIPIDVSIYSGIRKENSDWRDSDDKKTENIPILGDHDSFDYRSV